MENVIELKNVSKVFMKNKKATSLKEKIFRKKEISGGIRNVSFTVKKGEFVGYVGANGAGKSTTIKIMTGILIPDSGSVKCLNMVPWKEREKYTRDIGVVFGQKSLLWTDLNVIETLLLYKDIYEVSDADFKKRIDKYEKMLKIKSLLNKQARTLSFGEKMRCEVAASLLHKPKLLFLDEPTVGLDVVAKQEMRNFLREVNEKEGTTIMLTTHDMGDIEALCKRIILIDSSKDHCGKVIYDGSLEALKKRYVKTRVIRVKYDGFKSKKLAGIGLRKVKIIKDEKGFMEMSVDITKHDIKNVISDIMKAVRVDDLSVQEPELSEVVARIYREGKII